MAIMQSTIVDIKTSGSGTVEEIINALDKLKNSLSNLTTDQLPVTFEDQTLCTEIH